MKPSNSIQILATYFPNLNKEQLHQFHILKEIYLEWNSKINVISRKDTENFYVRHVMHSLSIAKYIDFKKGSNILDVGTGGGFPGIPLAIYFNQINFTLVDSIAKKIKVVHEVVNELKLNNVQAESVRAEKLIKKFDFVVSRAVTRLDRFCPWISKNISTKNINDIKNGIIYLKGGDLEEEVREISKKYNFEIIELSNFFKDPFFDTKSIVYLNKK